MGVRDFPWVISAEPFATAHRWMTTIAGSRLGDLQIVSVVCVMAVQEARETNAAEIKVHAIIAVDNKRVPVPREAAYARIRLPLALTKEVLEGNRLAGANQLLAVVGAGPEIAFEEPIELGAIELKHLGFLLDAQILRNNRSSSRLLIAKRRELYGK